MKHLQIASREMFVGEVEVVGIALALRMLYLAEVVHVELNQPSRVPAE